MEDGLKTLFISAFLLTLSSCSWLERMERSLVQDDEAKPSRRQVVPKTQYDELLGRFDELNKKYEALKEQNGGLAPSSSLVNELQNAPTVNSVSAGGNSVETVDVFGDKGIAGNGNAPVVLAAPVVYSSDMSDIAVNEAIAKYRKANLLVQNKNFSDGLKIYQDLERTAPTAIAVRAKYKIGEILIAQNEYDLAMQVFEDIVNRYGRSGVVINALKNLVICADKLGQQQKKDQYMSLLKDVFEVGV